MKMYELYVDGEDVEELNWADSAEEAVAWFKLDYPNLAHRKVEAHLCEYQE